MNGCSMSTETETDVAVPGPGTVIASDTAAALSGMASAGVLACVNCPGPPPLSGDSAKSPASTPVTPSLNVTPKTSIVSDVDSSAGSLLSIDVTVGAAASGSAGWLPAASLVPPSRMAPRTYSRAVVNSSDGDAVVDRQGGQAGLHPRGYHGVRIVQAQGRKQPGVAYRDGAKSCPHAERRRGGDRGLLA